MDKGKFGENLTSEYLKSKGYRIVSRNYHSRYGEIDIIAANDEYLAFVEVKTRSAGCVEHPATFVDKRKQNRIIKTALLYLASLELEDNLLSLQPRFDVCALILDTKNAKKVVMFDYFKDCFYAQ